MLSGIYLLVKSLKMAIFHIHITRWALYFPKVGEWVTQCAQCTVTKIYGDRASMSTAQSLWNELAEETLSSKFLEIFKTKLKNGLYPQAFLSINPYVPSWVFVSVNLSVVLFVAFVLVKFSLFFAQRLVQS